MGMKANEISIYLETAKKLGIIPNFWMTQEYLSIQDAEMVNDGISLCIHEDDWIIFPPLPLPLAINPSEANDAQNLTAFANSLGRYYSGLKVWSDFENFSIGKPWDFLDWEYTYQSDNFKDMTGKAWKVFRKNVRKWPQRNEGWKYTQRLPIEKEAQDLLVKWLRARNEEIADSETLLWFVLKGTHRSFIYRQDQLLGINVWDANAPYLMYRYCITDPDEPYLDEFARFLFYQNHPHKMVIDGGVLGNKGLERFKDKLNPIKKRPVYNRIIKGG